VITTFSPTHPEPLPIVEYDLSAEEFFFAAKLFAAGGV